MSLALIYWILLLLWLVYGLWGFWTPSQPYWMHGNSLFLFILFLILGWHAFGAPIRA
jgi:hypothetical protein